MTNNNLVLGIMGKMGSGKTTISHIFQNEYQFKTLEVDKYGHQALEKEKDNLVSHFGDSIISKEGSIIRAELGRLVFSDTEKLSLLNSLVHPRIKKDIVSTIQSHHDSRFIIDAAILFEIGLDEICDYIVYIEAPQDIIINRVTQSRSWNMDKILKVLQAQSYLECLKEKTDYIIFNNGDELKLKKQIEFFMLVITDY